MKASMICSGLCTQHFDKYILKDQLIPKILQPPLLMEVREYRKQLKKTLRPHLDVELLKLIMKPLNSFAHGEQGCTWHNLFYCRLLAKELKKSLKNHPEETDETILWSLFHLNYNSTSFYQYFTNYILKADAENYLQHLFYLQKKTRQQSVKPNVVFKTENSSLQNMVEKWLDEEIRYLERTQQLKLLIPVDAEVQRNLIRKRRF